MTSNPHEARELSVTLKCPESERYKQDGPWFVTRGTPESVREDIIKTFGLTEVNPDATTADVAFAAARITKAWQTASTTLGARSTSEPTPAAAASEPASEAEPETPADPLLVEIANVTDQQALTNCWADNKVALQANPDALEAWKAKGRELRDGAA